MHVVRSTSAFNVEAVKASALNKLMKKTIERLDEQLDATLDKHFSFQGEVRETKTVVDNTSRLAAIDKVLSMAGMYVKGQADVPKHDSVYIEIDPHTGIHKIVIGGAPTATALPLESEVLDEVNQEEDLVSPPQQHSGQHAGHGASGTPALHLVQNHISAPPESASVDDGEDVVPELDDTAEYEVIKGGRGRPKQFIPDSIRKHLKP